jgi:hypothetical protein
LIEAGKMILIVVVALRKVRPSRLVTRPTPPPQEVRGIVGFNNRSTALDHSTAYNTPTLSIGRKKDGDR